MEPKIEHGTYAVTPVASVVASRGYEFGGNSAAFDQLLAQAMTVQDQVHLSARAASGPGARGLLRGAISLLQRGLPGNLTALWLENRSRRPMVKRGA